MMTDEELSKRIKNLSSEEEVKPPKKKNKKKNKKKSGNSRLDIMGTAIRKHLGEHDGKEKETKS